MTRKVSRRAAMQMAAGALAMATLGEGPDVPLERLKRQSYVSTWTFEIVMEDGEITHWRQVNKKADG